MAERDPNADVDPAAAAFAALAAGAPRAGSFWRHYKGAVVEVTGGLVFEEDLDALVEYRHVGEERPWGRRLSVFLGEVSPGVPRFRPAAVEEAVAATLAALAAAARSVAAGGPEVTLRVSPVLLDRLYCLPEDCDLVTVAHCAAPQADTCGLRVAPWVTGKGEGEGEGEGQL